MLLKSTDNVLPMEVRRSARAGRHLGAILMDEGKLSAADAEQVLEAPARAGLALRRGGDRAATSSPTADLRQALAKQYEFPYLVSGPEGVSKELIAAWDPFHAVRRGAARGAHAAARALVQPRAPAPHARRLPARARARAAASSPPTWRWCSSQLGQRTLLDRRRLPRAAPAEHLQHRPTATGCRACSPGAPTCRPRCRYAGLTGLAVLPCGPLPPNPLELAVSRELRRAARQGAGRVRHVLIDTPPATEYADASAITFRAGDALLDLAQGPDARRGDRAGGARAVGRQRARRRHLDELRTSR